MKTLLPLFVIFLSMNALASAGGSGTNGGNSVASICDSIAKNIAAALKGIGQTEVSRYVPGFDVEHFWNEVNAEKNRIVVNSPARVYLNGDRDEPREATNTPETRRINYATEGFDQMSAERRIRLVAHENNVVLELEHGDQYKVTTPILRLFKEKKLDLNAIAETERVTNPKDPSLRTDLIYTDGMASGDGMTLNDATALCRMIETKHKEDYALTYCSILGTQSQDVTEETRFRNDYRLVGYTTHETTQGGKSVSVLWGLYRRSLNPTTRRETLPEYKQIAIPYLHRSVETFKVYGLRVYGLGPIDQKSPGKALLSSLGTDGLRLFETHYKTELAATLACKEAKLIYGADQPAYRGAFCVSIPDRGEFYFEIRTRNPFVK